MTRLAYSDDLTQLWAGDCLEVLPTLPAESVQGRKGIGTELALDYCVYSAARLAQTQPALI